MPLPIEFLSGANGAGRAIGLIYNFQRRSIYFNGTVAKIGPIITKDHCYIDVALVLSGCPGAPCS
jgi:hypothetical protein